jgi:nucleolar MIF4G domain-containing protein 1
MLSRKEQRKEDRRLKKERNKLYHERKPLYNQPDVENEEEKQPQRKQNAPQTITNKRTKNDLVQLEKDVCPQKKNSKKMLRKIAKGLIDDDFIDFINEVDDENKNNQANENEGIEDDGIDDNEGDEQGQDSEENESPNEANEGEIQSEEKQENHASEDQVIAKSDSKEEVSKKIKSFINKLSEGNISVIYNDILQIIENSERESIDEIIITIFLDAIRSNESAIMLQGVACGLICAIHKSVGDEFMYSLITKAYSDEKFRSSFCTILIFIYMFGSISCSLLFDMIEECISLQSDESYIVRVLQLLRYTGFSLRKENPEKLKVF